MSDIPPLDLNNPTIPIIGAPKITPIHPMDLQKLYEIFGLDIKEFGIPQQMIEHGSWLFLIPLVHALAVGTSNLKGAVDGCIDYIRENLPPQEATLPGEKPLVNGGGGEIN